MHKLPTLNDKSLRVLERKWMLKLGAGTPYEADIWIGQPCGEGKGLIFLLAASFQDEDLNPSGNHIAGLVGASTQHESQLGLLDALEREATDWHKDVSRIFANVRRTQLAEQSSAGQANWRGYHMESIDLIEVQKQLDCITPGEWTATSDETSVFDHSVVVFPHGTVLARHIERNEDREFIAAAPATIRKLMGWLAEVWESRLLITRERDATIRGLQERIKELEAQLTWSPLTINQQVKLNSFVYDDDGSHYHPVNPIGVIKSQGTLIERNADGDSYVYDVEVDGKVIHGVYDEFLTALKNGGGDV